MTALFKNFKIGMFALGAVALMMVAGWKFGHGGTEEVFSDKEVALENAFAGRGYGGVCCQAINRSCWHPIGMNFPDSLWYGGYSIC
ncbi:hypothetical protein [Mongoliitalea lutea]|nr:hypothetical protein [Mongoliitalea lutea]